MHKTIIRLIVIVGALVTVFSSYGQELKENVEVNPVYEPFPFSNQYIDGYLGHYVDNAIHDELMKFSIEDYVFPYYTSGITNGRWITGEFTGKYMHSLCMAYKYKVPKDGWNYRLLKPRMDNIFYAWKHYSELNDGYIGIHMKLETKPWEEMWNVWHVKYVLLGLLQYYDLFGNPEALETAIALGNSFINEFGEGKRSFEGSHLGPVFLESMAMLYKRTGDQKFLDNCYWIMKDQVEPDLIDIINKEDELPFWHVYTLQSHLISTLELYEIEAKNPEYLEAAIHAVDIMVNRKQFITGGFANLEHFTNDHVFGCTTEDEPQEACTSAHFIYLCRKLFNITGESKYLDYIEHTLYNSALTSKNPHNGYETSYFSPLQGHKEWKITDHINGTPCCSQSITRELVWLPGYVWGRDRENGFAVFLYNPGRIEGNILDSKGDSVFVSVHFDTEFPVKGGMKIQLKLDEPTKFNIKLRVPDWCSTFLASVDGNEYNGTPGTFLEIDRKWANYDVINVVFDLPVKVIEDKSYKGFVAIKRGPQILAVDGFLNKDVKNLDEISIEPQLVANLEPVSQKDIPEEWWGKQVYTSPMLHPSGLSLAPYAEVGQIHHSNYHTLIRIDDGWKNADNKAFTFHGSEWMIEYKDGHFGSSAHKTSNEGDYAEFEFTGTGIELYTCSYYSPFNEKLENTTLIDIYIDGEYQGEFGQEAQHLQWQIFKRDNLISGKHTLKIVNKNRSACIDYVRYK